MSNTSAKTFMVLFCSVCQLHFKGFPVMLYFYFFQYAKSWVYPSLPIYPNFQFRTFHFSTAVNSIIPGWGAAAFIVPLCACAMLRAMDSPRPKPPVSDERDLSGL